KKAAPVKKVAPAPKAAAAKKPLKNAPSPKKTAPAKAPAKKVAAKPVVAKKAAKPAAKPVLAKKPAAKPAVKSAVPAKAAPVKAAAKAALVKPAVKAVPVKPAAKVAPVKPAAKAAPKPVAKPEAKPAPKAESPKKATAKPAPAAKPAVPVKSSKPAKKVPTIAPEIRFAETSKVAASPAEVRKALRAKEAKKDLKPVPMPKINTKSARKYEPEFTRSVLDAKAEEAVVITGPTQRYSDSELLEFKELIQNKLNAAKQELAYLNGLITRKDSMSGEDSDTRYMTMEDGSLSMEREQLSQMASRQIDFIEKLEKALMRIENKTYGICRVTGKLIDKARLRAVPHATLSMEAKTGINRPGSSF
ncbi:MAG: hypothetical protein RLZZ595_988, partial [Bacteroidota bacterium]